MEKKKNLIIVLLIIIIIMLATLLILVTTGNKNGINNMGHNKIYSADQYITLEDLTFNDKVTTKKVKLNYLDDEVTKQFYIDQQEIIDSINPYDGAEFNAEYKLKYFINNNILSVVYTIEQTDQIGTCATKMAVTNIDLVNNKVVTEEELLAKGGTSYKILAEKLYDEELEKWKKINANANRTLDYDEVTFEDFSTNKDKYVTMAIKKLPSVIYTYIEDGKIKYDYYVIKKDTLFHQVGKGGCFNWETVTLGNY